MSVPIQVIASPALGKRVTRESLQAWAQQA